MKQSSVYQFLDLLASDAPAPGGGTAAAVSGAMTSALLAMALRISQKKTEQDLSPCIGSLDALREKLLELAEEDRRAFELYMAARKMPKDTPEQKAERDKALASALLRATEVPLQTMKAISQAIEEAKPVVGLVIPAVASDLYSAVRIGEAALDSAFANVKINATKEELMPLLHEAEALLQTTKASIKHLEEQARALLGI